MVHTIKIVMEQDLNLVEPRHSQFDKSNLIIVYMIKNIKFELFYQILAF